MADEKPCGVVVVVTSPTGSVIANAADFDRSGYGGFTLQRTQAIRASQRAKWAAVRAYMSNVLADALDTYTIDRIWERMREKGWTLTEMPVNYEEPDHG